jgi:hypothetical protein
MPALSKMMDVAAPSSSTAATNPSTDSSTIQPTGTSTSAALAAAPTATTTPIVNRALPAIENHPGYGYVPGTPGTPGTPNVAATANTDNSYAANSSSPAPTNQSTGGDNDFTNLQSYLNANASMAPQITNAATGVLNTEQGLFNNLAAPLESATFNPYAVPGQYQAGTYTYETPDAGTGAAGTIPALPSDWSSMTTDQQKNWIGSQINTDYTTSTGSYDALTANILGILNGGTVNGQTPAQQLAAIQNQDTYTGPGAMNYQMSSGDQDTLNSLQNTGTVMDVLNKNAINQGIYTQGDRSLDESLLGADQGAQSAMTGVGTSLQKFLNTNGNTETTLNDKVTGFQGASAADLANLNTDATNAGDYIINNVGTNDVDFNNRNAATNLQSVGNYANYYGSLPQTGGAPGTPSTNNSTAPSSGANGGASNNAYSAGNSHAVDGGNYSASNGVGLAGGTLYPATWAVGNNGTTATLNNSMTGQQSADLSALSAFLGGTPGFTNGSGQAVTNWQQNPTTAQRATVNSLANATYTDPGTGQTFTIGQTGTMASGPYAGTTYTWQLNPKTNQPQQIITGGPDKGLIGQALPSFVPVAGNKPMVNNDANVQNAGPLTPAEYEALLQQQGGS